MGEDYQEKGPGSSPLARTVVAMRGIFCSLVAQFTDLQWQESAETEALVTLVRQERRDEKQVLAQSDKLLNIENQIKRQHTGLLVRLKNLLTSEQQAQLQELARGGGPRPRALREKQTK